MGTALHEVAHLVSHPPQQGKKISVFIALGEGLLEGLTHVVTEDILNHQGIAPYTEHKYGDREGEDWCASSLKCSTQTVYGYSGKALFLGQSSELSPLPQRFGPRGFDEIKNLATMHNSKEGNRVY